MTTAISFSRQNGTGSLARAFCVLENLVIKLVLESIKTTKVNVSVLKFHSFRAKAIEHWRSITAKLSPQKVRYRHSTVLRQKPSNVGEQSKLCLGVLSPAFRQIKKNQSNISMLMMYNNVIISIPVPSQFDPVFPGEQLHAYAPNFRHDFPFLHSTSQKPPVNEKAFKFRFLNK